MLEVTSTYNTCLTPGEEIIENYVDFYLLISDTGFVVSFDRICMRCLSNLPTENSHLASYWGKGQTIRNN